MKTNTVMGLLSLFGGEAEGGMKENMPVLTPQATTSGDLNKTSASAAGERDEAKRRDEEFRALMQGEYKEQFTAYFQETFNRRFKEQKEMKEELERSRAVLGKLEERFGVEGEQLLTVMQTAGEKADLDDGEKGDSPETVAENGSFTSREEIDREIAQAVLEAVEQARLETEQALVAEIRARGLRPSEGALSNACADALRDRASGLSRAQRAEVARRAARGERIKL